MMESTKEAKTVHPIHELIRKRWSPRAFADWPVEEEMLLQMFEAASWSFSSANKQPWRYRYAHKGTESFQKFVDCLNPGNQLWAKNAAVLVLSIAKVTWEYDPPRNRHAYHDLGAATMLFVVEGMSNGIYSHPMGGFNLAKARETFDLSEEYDPVAFIAVGYLGDSNSLPEKLKAQEIEVRTRRPVSEIVSG